MSMHGLRPAIAVAVLLGLTTGCRLWQKDTDPPVDPYLRAASEVVPASATEPIDEPPLDESAPEEEPGFELSDLAPSAIRRNIKEMTGNGPNEDVARQLLREGEELFRQENYAEAAEKFGDAADRWPDSSLEEDALFLLGESYYFMNEYPDAEETFETLMEKHGHSRYVDTIAKRMYAIGRYWQQLHQEEPIGAIRPNLTDQSRPRFDTHGRAIRAYQKVAQWDPRGPLADDAVMAVAKAHYANKRYEDAAYYFDMLRKEHADSEHQLRAHVLAVQSKLRIYQGERYDRTALDEADKIAAQALVQFRGRLGEEASRLGEVRGRIIAEKAQRDLADAEYYEGKGRYKAARFYYGELIKNYPGTQHAERAQRRLEAIRDKTDSSNPLQWLSNALS